MLFELLVSTAICENELRYLIMAYVEENFICFKMLHDGHPGCSVIPAGWKPAKTSFLITFRPFVILCKYHHALSSLFQVKQAAVDLVTPYTSAIVCLWSFLLPFLHAF